jgi:type IV secretion system protein TrbL
MAAAGSTILPDSYFDGLSSLWGACAYVGGAIVALGLVAHAVRARPGPADFLWVFGKVLLIAVSTLFLREWLMRLNDIVLSFGSFIGVDPRAVDEKFITFISGKVPAEPDTSVWDVIWDTGSIGTAIAYALLWMFGWLSWAIQYIVKLVGGILLTAGWALSPLFLSFFMLRPMTDVGRKYLIGLAALVCWPFGWTIAAVVTNAMLDAAASASLLPVILPGAMVAPALTVLLIGAWMLLSSILAPYVTTRVLMMGANPAAAFAQAFGGVGQAAMAGGVGAATAAVTGGATAGAVVASAAVGAMSAGTESAMRGGGSARTTSTATAGVAGFYGGRFVRDQTAAMKEMASAASRRAAASETFAAQFGDRARRREKQRSDFSHQPHHPDPNQAAIEIEAHEKK